MAATLTQDDIDLIVAGVLGADPRVFAIQGEITGDLEIERFGAISLTFTENTDPNIASSIVAGGENAELAAQIDALEAELALIKAKTDLITPEGVVQVSEASQGRIPETKAYVFAFNRSTGAAVTGDAANITAKWIKDYGTPTALTDTNPTEIEDGVYAFDLSETERTIGTVAYILPESSTSNVSVVGMPAQYTTKGFSVLPVSGSVQARVSASYITVYTAETTTIALGLEDSSGDPVDTTGMNLEMVFESGTTEVTISNASITKATNGVSFAVTSDLSGSERDWVYSLRKTTDEEVLQKGVLSVQYAPNN